MTATSEPVVSTESGTLLGVYSTDGAVRAFKGVPYAQPPVGDLRWRPPQPVQPWSGVREAREFPPAPIQPPRNPNTLTFLGNQPTSEDCLYLNIWSEAGGGNERRPVIVWLPYGAYITGSSNGFMYDGERLAKLGVVVVIPNFRLNRFGFLAHPELSTENESGVSGNWCLLDQIAVLQWVRRNIEAFGGDPDCVTLAGQSSGASSVSLLMASPLAKGLFHRAIGQSGGEFEMPWTNANIPHLTTREDAEATGIEIMRAVGARSIAELRRVPADAILNALQASSANGPVDWTKGLVNPIFSGGFPILDGYVVPKDGLMATFATGSQNSVPLIVGSTAKEGGGKYGPRTLADFVAQAKAMYGNLAGEFLAQYPARDDDEARSLGSMALGDVLFRWQTWVWARLNSRTSRDATYVYHFDRIPPFPHGAEFTENEGRPAREEIGAMHSLDIPYVFRNLHVRDWPWEPVDAQLSDAMSSYWVSFARRGDPNGAGRPEWPRFDEAAKRTLFFGDSIRVLEAPDQQRLAFWDRFYQLASREALAVSHA